MKILGNHLRLMSLLTVSESTLPLILSFKLVDNIHSLPTSLYCAVLVFKSSGQKIWTCWGFYGHPNFWKLVVQSTFSHHALHMQVNNI